MRYPKSGCQGCGVRDDRLYRSTAEHKLLQRVGGWRSNTTKILGQRQIIFHVQAHGVFKKVTSQYSHRRKVIIGGLASGHYQLWSTVTIDKKVKYRTTIGILGSTLSGFCTTELCVE